MEGFTAIFNVTVQNLCIRLTSINVYNEYILCLAQVTQKSLRKVIGVVPQDTVLFNNDIRYKMLRNKVMSVVVGICEEMNVRLSTYTSHR